MDGGLVTVSDSVPSPEIRAEASAWLARLRADNRDRSDEAAFREWLAENPMHAAAFEAVDRVWSEVGGLGELRDMRRPGVYDAPPGKGLASRRAVMAGAGLFVVAGASGVFWKSAQAKVYQTDVGEQKHVSLDDGSQLFLDAQTRISVAFSDTERMVDMSYGRANFRVVPDSKRPFIVEAAERKIVATHCSFDVRCEGGQVQVVLIHGEADVRQSATPNTKGERLTSGERLVAANDLEKRDKPDMTRATAWQVGYEMFENEKLSQAVDEMNRYSTQKLEVDASAANLKVSGVYRVGDNSAFARSLSKLLPITVRETDDSLLLTAESAD
jgi:transmembrane sensor